MADKEDNSSEDSEKQTTGQKSPEQTPAEDKPEEIGGRKGLDPTRYGDWERKGILSDF